MRRSLLLPLLMLAAPAVADPLKIAVDLPAVHSLVAQVAGDKAEIDFVLKPGASPHGYAMRPSETRILQDADVVVWIGSEQFPWLARGIANVTRDATSVELITLPGTTILERRDRPVFAEDDHDHAGNKHDDHSHDDHDHAHHGRVDPHAWLDPMNAKVWLTAIAEELAKADPDNARTYRDNADRSAADLDTLHSEINEQLASARGTHYVVFHDAYQYFENRYNIPSTAAIAKSDATNPGPARLTELQKAMKEHNITCVFSEPQFNPHIVALVSDGTEAKTAVIDPLGRDLDTGPGLYPTLISTLANTLAECLAK